MKLTKLKNSSITLMLIIVIAKLIGMFRDIVIANYYGTTNVSDAFLTALTLPTTLFFLIGHSLSTAYIPMYNKVKAESGEKEALQFSNKLLTAAILLSTIIVLILMIFPYTVIKLFASGFDQVTADLTVRLIRISAASIYIMNVVNIFGGYLHANRSFIVPAAISLPRNAALVVAVVISSYWGLDWLGWGILAAYIVEWLFVLPFVIRKGYFYVPEFNLNDENLKQTLYIVGPIVLGVCVSQINKIIDRSMASLVIEGGISAMFYAVIINNGVQEVLVTGVITILFSKCSEYVAKKEYEKVKNNLSKTLNVMVLLIIPACIGVIILAEPLVSLVLCRGEFNQHSLRMTSGALRFYTFGLLFLALRDTLIKVFYAYKDTKTTTMVSITAIIANIVMNLMLGPIMGINGLALATTLSAIYSAITLYVLLRKKIGDFGLKKMLVVALKSLIGCVPMGIMVFFLNQYLAIRINGILALFICIVAACLFYFGIEIIIRNEPVVYFFKKLTNKEK